jgi:hypothetical protein
LEELSWGEGTLNIAEDKSLQMAEEKNENLLNRGILEVRPGEKLKTKDC